jgi:BASS family bile acid:Na+ symporter
MNNTATIILGIALAITMWGMGLNLVIDDFKRVLRSPKLVILGLLNQLILLPLIAYLLVSLLPASPEVAVGIMILSASPGGPTSNLLSLLAKADTALSVTLTAITSVVTIFTIPFIVNIALEHFGGLSQSIQLPILETILKMVLIVIAPMFLGMIIKRYAPSFSQRMERPVRIISVSLLALIIVGIVIKEKENIVSYFADAGLLALALNVITICLGLLTARVFNLGKKSGVTIALESGIQNGTMALFIAGTLLSNPAYGIAPAVYSLIMYITGGMLVMYALRK